MRNKDDNFAKGRWQFATSLSISISRNNEFQEMFNFNIGEIGWVD